jgi:hypothetical protein
MVATIARLKSWKGREGYGWHGDLCLDGRKVAFVSDDGDGGMLRWEVSDPAAFDAWQRSHGETGPEADDMAAAKLADAADVRTRLLRACRTATLFSVPGDAEGSYRTVKGAFTPAIKAFILGKYPNATIVNEVIR